MGPDTVRARVVVESVVKVDEVRAEVVIDCAVRFLTVEDPVTVNPPKPTSPEYEEREAEVRSCSSMVLHVI